MSTALSGVDLARQALIAAREAAKKNGATQTKNPKRRTTTAVRRDGREPLGLGAAIGMMMTERGLAAPAAGGSVLAQFDAILAAAAPELAGHVQAVGFDTDTGRLDIVPDAPAYGTQLRWITPKLITTANERVQGGHVRTIHVLPPAPMKADPASAAAAPAPPAVPVERRTPPEGYHRAIEAHRQAARPPLTNPAIAEAVERQCAAMRELSRRAFPEPEAAAHDAPSPIGQVRAERRRQADASHAAALRRARAERATRDRRDGGRDPAEGCCEKNSVRTGTAKTRPQEVPRSIRADSGQRSA
ncbi:DciA family protein [Streptomyces sp. NPDC058417]|uniref:DciA family protein n=1 Tax=unclassified Streptomyces TaxID=2593676 RepID=UPI0036582B8A